MRKTMKIAVAASALMVGLWAAPTLFAQQTAPETPPQGGVTQGQTEMMGQGMMGMMNMMQQMNRMADFCTKAMQTMHQQMPPQAPKGEQPPKQDG